MTQQQRDVTPDFRLEDFSPLTLEQLYFVNGFLFGGQSAVFGYADLSPLMQPDGEGADQIMAALRFFLATNCPGQPVPTNAEFRRIFQVMMGLGGAATRAMYSFGTELFPDDWITFLNCGYDDFGQDEPMPKLTGAEIHWPYAVRLYRKTVGDAPLKGRHVLEIGSGRGGGTAHIARHWQPARTVGMDISAGNVEFSRRIFGDLVQNSLAFECGDAEQMPFGDGEFDVVINLQACNYYQSFEQFAAEVDRVLRPGGDFLVADFSPPAKIMELIQACEARGLKLTSQTDITLNVRQALRDFDFTAMVERNPTIRRKELYIDFLQGIFRGSQVLKPQNRYYRLAFRKN